MEMEAYQNIVDDDPENFIEVRRRLDSWFPRLEHVATSAMGASIGPHIAAFTVTPQVRFLLPLFARTWRPLTCFLHCSLFSLHSK